MAYICLCNPTTDIQIIEVLKKNISEEQLKKDLQICQNCKSCSSEINRLSTLYKNNQIAVFK